MKFLTLSTIILFAATPFTSNADCGCGAASAAQATTQATAQVKEAPQGIKELTTVDEFQKEVANSQIPVVVKFFATWCPPCKKIAAEFDALSKNPELAGKVKFIAINVDKGSAISAKEGVMSMPTLIFYKKGQAPQRSMGYKSRQALRELVKTYFNI